MTKRAYEKSHPWIDFDPKSGRFTARMWMLLGETTSKFEHLAGAALRPDLAAKMNTIYLAKGVRATTAIEGNTLSEEQVAQLLEKTLELPPSKEYLAREVRNIVDACNKIWQDIMAGSHGPLTPETICSFNAMVLSGLDVESHVEPGKTRQVSVGVMGYRGAPAEDCAYLLERLVELLERDEFKPGKDHGLVPAVLAAIVAHLYIAWIHPFGDGNGRTARLLEFAILARSGVPQPAAQLLSNHYNETRTEYYRHLDLASKDRDQGVPKFVEYALQGLVDGLRQQIDEVKQFQLDVAWRNYVYEQFRTATTAQKRLRDLVLKVSDVPKGLTSNELLTLTPQLAAHYLGKRDAKAAVRRLRRDLNQLVSRDLLVLKEGRWFANVDRMRAFIPQRAQQTHV